MIKDGQLRSLRRWLGEGCTLREAARRCGMDEKTARRYRGQLRLRGFRDFASREAYDLFLHGVRDPRVDLSAAFVQQLVRDQSVGNH